MITAIGYNCQTETFMNEKKCRIYSLFTNHSKKEHEEDTNADYTVLNKTKTDSNFFIKLLLK